MARIGTYPTTFEDRKSISISDLRKWEYLQPDSWRSGTLSWSRGGTVHSQISICVDMVTTGPYLELSYNWQGQSIRYKVNLTALTSNLGAGNVWYFICPVTGNRCRKLYFKNGYFQYRGEGYYEKQIQSKYSRHLEKTYGVVFKADKLREQVYSRHFRKFYSGRVTKRYAQILKQLKAAENVSEKHLISLLVK
ncbi:hypothetical protein [Chitinophaga varians]|uniref:hypothetical protein n=1 Tax=Chitinophaga varians TaxID=2202339 RepID=UPI00165F5116|nr:hypothetical protein [Chitinophaga varians]MBC9910572.1 hypothetical protein [Chitinophaga varians]